MYTKDVLYGLSPSVPPYTPLMRILPHEVWGHVISFLILGDNQHPADRNNFKNFIRVCKECYFLAIDSLELCKVNLYFMRLAKTFSMERFEILKQVSFASVVRISPSVEIDASHLFGSQNEAYEIDFDKCSIESFSISCSFQGSWAFILSNSYRVFFSHSGALAIYDDRLTQQHLYPQILEEQRVWCSAQVIDDVLYCTSSDDQCYALNLIDYIQSNYTQLTMKSVQQLKHLRKYPSLVITPYVGGFSYHSLLDRRSVFGFSQFSLPLGKTLMLASTRCENSLPYLYCVILNCSLVDEALQEWQLQLGRFVLTPGQSTQQGSSVDQTPHLSLL